MKRILRVARTEYANHVRSKAFVIGLLAFPVFIGGAILVQVLFQDQKVQHHNYLYLQHHLTNGI